MDHINEVDKNYITKYLNAKVLGITGLRPQKIDGYNGGPTETIVRNQLKDLISKCNFPFVISGMAQGVDTWAAEEVLASYDKRLIAAIPYRGQESLWPKDKIKHYNEILEKAEYVCHICEPGFSAKKLQIRNEWIVDNSYSMIAVWDGNSGGTANCIEYALKNGFSFSTNFCEKKCIYLIDVRQIKLDICLK